MTDTLADQRNAVRDAGGRHVLEHAVGEDDVDRRVGQLGVGRVRRGAVLDRALARGLDVGAAGQGLGDRRQAVLDVALGRAALRGQHAEVARLAEGARS